MDNDDFNERDFLDSLDNYDEGMDSGGHYGSYHDEPRSDMNIAEKQLDFTKTLADIRKFLSGYREGYDEKGNYTLIPPKKVEEIPFNDYGVDVLMGHIRFYLNENTILSNYKSERINRILFDLGNLLGNEIEQTYEILGMDTDYKKRKFPLIVMNILRIVESAYNRALGAEERRSLRQFINVNQSEVGRTNMGGQGPSNYGMPQQNRKRRSLLNPFGWGR